MSVDRPTFSILTTSANLNLTNLLCNDYFEPIIKQLYNTSKYDASINVIIIVLIIK